MSNNPISSNECLIGNLTAFVSDGSEKMRLIMLMAVQYVRLPNDRVLKSQFNKENNWIDDRFGIGRHKM